MNLYIKKWVGRLGNNMLQLLNVISIGLYYNYNIIIPYHKYFKEKYIILNKNITIHNEVITNDDQFFRKHKIKNIDSHLFNDTNIKNKAVIILKNIFSLQQTVPLNNNDVVIHIRSGDIFKTDRGPNPNYPPPPLSYYINILNNNHFENIYLIAEDTRNPTINKLLELYPNIRFKLQSLNEDIKLILQSRNVIMSIGTFIPMLLTISDNIKNVYKTSFETGPIGSHITIHNTNLKKYYKKMFPWKNTEEQRELMMTYQCSPADPC